MSEDPRVQAIRCCSCHRLRPHPVADDRMSAWCPCGGREFVPSEPVDDAEFAWALVIYEKEIKERGLWKYT